jgi:hypothetical protein
MVVAQAGTPSMAQSRPKDGITVREIILFNHSLVYFIYKEFGA